MTKIFFFSPQGHLPMKSEVIKSLCTSHGWQAEGETWVYGVAIPNSGVDPMEVADALTAAGIIVLPGVHDHSTNVDPQIVTALAQFGLVAGDKGIDAAAKMHQACGMPVLRPHLF